ncbi:MAG: hypothetical protein KDJ90_17595, partial [Nitratireductor sp.]|nr:hypothetical protein [Nitratireductor sp.]
LMVLALAGDSTITTFMQMLTDSCWPLLTGDSGWIHKTDKGANEYAPPGGSSGPQENGERIA